MNFETDYVDLVTDVIDQGQERLGRNGKTRALFGQVLTISELSKGMFPLLTQRKVFYKGVFGELAAFVRGATTIGEFKRWGCNYWDANAKAWIANRGKDLEDMEIGQVYGAQWINWEKSGYNQLENLLTSIQADPMGRRHILTSYSPITVACLPPCHLLAQFFVNDDERLDCQVYMRSVDLVLGLPSDIILYSALLLQISNELSLTPGDLIFALGDTHIYENHVQTFIDKQLNAPYLALPLYEVRRAKAMDFTPDDILIHGYKHGEVINYEFNV